MGQTINSHQWASKMEVQRLLSGKHDLKTESDFLTANDEPIPPRKSLSSKVISFFERPEGNEWLF